MKDVDYNVKLNKEQVEWLLNMLMFGVCSEKSKDRLIRKSIRESIFNSVSSHSSK